LKLKQEKLIAGIKLFEEAALYAETDDQLFSALTSRNQLRETYIAAAIKVVTNKLGMDTLNNSEVSDVMLTLDQAEAFTGNQQLLKKIDKLREKVIAKQ